MTNAGEDEEKQELIHWWWDYKMVERTLKESLADFYKIKKRLTIPPSNHILSYLSKWFETSFMDDLCEIYP